MRMFHLLFEHTKKTVEYLESPKTPFANIILTFFFAVTLRNFIELFSTRGALTFYGLVHLYTAYIALALTFILLFYLATKTPVLKAARVILPSFLILVIAPTLDLIISRGTGFDMNYMLPGLHDDLAIRFLTFFGSFKPSAVTPGIRFEIALVLIVSCFYFYVKTAHFLKSIFYSFLMYTILFIYGAFPFILKGLKYLTGIDFWPMDITLAFFAVLVSLVIGTILSYLANPAFFQRFLRDICPYRVAHYELMVVLGVIIGLNTDVFRLTQLNIFYFIFLPVAGFCAGLHSLIGNNLVDLEIDKVSNKNRILVSAQLGPETYQKLQLPFLCLALFLSALINFKILFLIVLFMGNYYLYSMPPLRLKRITFLSKLIISLNSLIMIMAGYLLIAGDLQKFPLAVSLFFLLAFTAAANFIDLKDFAGDKKSGIKTIPVVLGLERSKKIIGVFFVLSYVLVGFLLKNTLLIPPLLLLGIWQFYLINREDYREGRVFTLYLISLLGLILYLTIFGMPL